MKLDYTTTDKDYIDFYEFNATNTPQGRKSMRTQKIAVPVILAIVTLCTLCLGANMIFILIQVALYAVFSWMWCKYQDKSIRKNAENLLLKLEAKGQKPYSEKGCLDFGEKEITDQRGDQKLTLHYSDIASVYRNNGAVYVYMTEGSRIILVPASVFTEESTFEMLIEELKKKVAPEKFM